MTSCGGTVDLFGRQIRKCDALRASKSALSRFSITARPPVAKTNIHMRNSTSARCTSGSIASNPVSRAILPVVPIKPYRPTLKLDALENILYALESVGGTQCLPLQLWELQKGEQLIAGFFEPVDHR